MEESKESESMSHKKMSNNYMSSLFNKLDIEHVENMSKSAYNDKNLEFEAIIRNDKSNRANDIISSDKFKNVREFCRKKTCTGNWRCIKDREKTLDISINDFRITINGMHYITEFCTTNDLNTLPTHCWNVMKKKTLVKTHKIDDLNVKLNLKEEIHIDKTNILFKNLLDSWKEYTKFFRLKNRYSYLIDEMYCIDLTVVKQSPFPSSDFISSNVLEVDETYEIELEYVPNILPNEEMKRYDLMKWQKIMNNILCALENTKILVSRDILQNAEKEYYSLISKQKITMLNNRLSKKYQISPNVVTLTQEELYKLKDESENYYVTPKTDGIRASGFIDSSGKLFLIIKTTKKNTSNSNTFEYTGITFRKTYKNSILDGELITKTKNNLDVYHFVVFDCYYWKGIDIRKTKLDSRRSRGDVVLQHEHIEKREFLINDMQCQISLKNFIPLITEESFEDQCIKCFREIEESPYENDGLIFTPQDFVGGDDLYNEKDSDKEEGEEKSSDGDKFIKSGINFERLFKWKDSKFNSIDFRIKFLNIIQKPEKENNDYVLRKYQICELLIGYGSKNMYNTKLSTIPYTRENFLEDIKEDIKNNNSVELRFQPSYPYIESSYYAALPIIDNKVCCKIENEWIGDVIKNNDIVEMTYDMKTSSEYKWIPIRVRKDKKDPNFIVNALSVWKSIHFPITKNMLTGNEEMPNRDDILNNELNQDVYYDNKEKKEDKLRDFHRWTIKQMLFDESIGKSEDNSQKLLDIGSGKGGDINRYLDTESIHKVIGVDNSVDNIQNRNDGAYKRLTNIYIYRKKKKNQSYANNKIMFVAGDAGKLFSDRNTFIHNNNEYYAKIVERYNIFAELHTFDTVSVFFALHYFFKSKETFQNFIKNVDNNVKENGYFIGCCFDGNIVHNKFVEEKTNNLKFTNKNDELILQIDKKYEGNFDDTENSIGKTIDVLVENINKKHSEYLVNFDFLTKELFKIGFSHVSSKNFEEIYNSESSNIEKYNLDSGQKSASFLNRTFIFKRKSTEGLTQILV